MARTVMPQAIEILLHMMLSCWMTEFCHCDPKVRSGMVSRLKICSERGLSSYIEKWQALERYAYCCLARSWRMKNDFSNFSWLSCKIKKNKNPFDAQSFVYLRSNSRSLNEVRHMKQDDYLSIYKAHGNKWPLQCWNMQTHHHHHSKLMDVLRLSFTFKGMADAA